MKITNTIMISMMLIGVANAVDNDWPRFRGPNGDGLSPIAKGIPTTWSATQNILWSTDLPKTFTIVAARDASVDPGKSGSVSDMQSKSFNPFSCPIVSGGKVFVASSGARTTEHRLLCFNLVDGKPLWETPVPPGPSVESEIDRNLDSRANDPTFRPNKLFSHRFGYNLPTPCSDGERVFVTFGTGIMAAIDFQGKLLWKQLIVDMRGKEKMKLPLDNNWFYYLCVATSPIVYKDLVIQVMDNGVNGPHHLAEGVTEDVCKSRPSYIMAFDRQTGEVKYQVSRPPIKSCSTPLLVIFKGTTVLIHSNDIGINGIDPDNGTTIWTVKARGIGASSLAYADGVLYARVSDGGIAIPLDASHSGDITGIVKWTVPDEVKVGGYCSPVIVNGRMYRFGAGGGYGKNSATPIGKLVCVDTASGKQTHVLDMPGFSSWASPVASADGYIYFATGAKSFVVKDGPKPEIVGINDLGDFNPASPALVDGKLIIRGSAKLWCIGKP